MKSKKYSKEKFGKYMIRLITSTSFKTRKQYMDCFTRFTRFIDLNEEEDDIVTLTNMWLANSVKKNKTGKVKVNPLLKSFLTHFYLCYDINIKDIPKCSKSRRDDGKDKFLTIDQIRTIMANIDGFHGLAIRVLFETGLRISELMDITISDINFKTCMIQGVGKGDKPFKVSISKRTRNGISSMIKFRKKRNPHLEHPFRYDKKVKDQTQTFRYHLRQCGKQVGIKDLHPHRFRFSLGRILRVEKGWDLEKVRKAMRHESIETTQIYSRATYEEVEEAMRKEVFLET